MPWVWVSIGSNIQREKNVRSAIRALRERFGELQVSPVYETPSEGFDGDPFFNLVAGFETRLTPAQLHAALRAIESENGRVRGAQKFSSRTLDIDALTYGGQVTGEGGKALPRDEILRYAFVLKPLADVAPDEVHPEEGVSYAELWRRFSGERGGVREVPLDL
jgi:2-amino-4-hydroxy-6-hydroxymethyldihydropteridine diphosphokinase